MARHWVANEPPKITTHGLFSLGKRLGLTDIETRRVMEREGYSGEPRGCWNQLTKRAIQARKAILKAAGHSSTSRV